MLTVYGDDDRIFRCHVRRGLRLSTLFVVDNSFKWR